MIDCIEKLDKELLFDYERIILSQAKSLWTNGSKCNHEIFKNFRILVGKKRSSEIEPDNRRINALDVLNGALLTFEDYEPEEKEERTESFDYCTFYLVNAGMNQGELIDTIKFHFKLE